MNSTFNQMFPDVMTDWQRFYTISASVSAVIVFAGLLVAASRGAFGDLNQLVRGLLSTALVVLLISIFPDLANVAQDMTHSIVGEIGSDPSKTHEKFATLIAGPEVEGESEVGFWGILWDSTNGGIGKAMIYAVLLICAKLAVGIMWLCFLLQNVILIIGVAAAPLFLGMSTLEATKGIAGKFYLSFTAVLCWPIGWCCADVVTAGILKLAVGSSAGSHLPTGIETVLLILILSVWIIGSTIGAPLAITKLLVSGIQVGSSLLQSVGTGASQGVSYGGGAGVTVGMSGGGKLAATAAAVGGAAGGMASGALGSTGTVIPAAIGIAAVVANSKGDGQKAKEIASRMEDS